VVLRPDMDLHRAMHVLLENDISGAPVVDEQGNLVGMLSERDCLTVAFRASYHQELGGTVAEFMSSEVQTIEANSDIVQVAELFFNSRYRRFPVMEENRLIGLISRRDILKAVEELW
jgi:CBS domain-containing protein